MNGFDYLQIFITLLILILTSPVLGRWMYRIFEHQNITPKFLSRCETIVYRLSGVDAKQEMDWKSYASAVLSFNLVGFVTLFLIQILQSRLPLNPQKLLKRS